MKTLQPRPLRTGVLWFVVLGIPSVVFWNLILSNSLIRGVLIVATGVVLPQLIVRWQQQRVARDAARRSR